MNFQEKIEYFRNFIFDPGEPQSELTNLQDGGSYQQFKNVTFYQNPKGECFEVHGAILTKYTEFNETHGDLGYPISDEMDNLNVEGGKLSQFENGLITWDHVNWTEVILTKNTGGPAPIDAEGGDTPAVRSWEVVFEDTESTIEEQTKACGEVKLAREVVPDHVINKLKGISFNGKVNPKPSNISPATVEEWIWDEIQSEGSFDSINTTDNNYVTWGKGIARTNIAVVLKKMFAKSEALMLAFRNIGISLGNDGIIKVFNTYTSTILYGDDAYKIIKAETKLLDFLVEITRNADFQDLIVNTQWTFAMNRNRNARFIQFIKENGWSKDAVQLGFHLDWWLPGYGWSTYELEYKNTGGDPAKIIILFAQKQLQYQEGLIPKLKTFAGNAFKKYIAIEKHRAEPPEEECIIFTDNGISYYVPI
jgi:hypothetical protein